MRTFSRGADSTELLSTYQNRSNAKYKTALGETLLNVAQCVPDGVLVFFPSYAVLGGNSVDSGPFWGQY